MGSTMFIGCASPGVFLRPQADGSNVSGGGKLLANYPND
jgi:hypothetical protein